MTADVADGRALIAASLARPYRVPLTMVALMALVPCYLLIAEKTARRTLHVPAISLDAALPLQPAWALVYGTLYLFLIALPIFVVRQDAQIRRTVRAYLFIWLTAYLFFLAYPTIAPRPPLVAGDGFAAWGLRFLYDADPPYNCFPSLHVAHSFVSAIACWRVHRGVGIGAAAAAALVGLSTLLTKQHYVVDVVAGISLAALGCALFLRAEPDVSELDRRAAPYLAATLLAGVGVLLAGCWTVFRVVA